MKCKFLIYKPLFILLLIILSSNTGIKQNNETNSNKKIVLTDIGTFGMLRKARPGIPAHYHSGIDIKRPSQNYQNEPIFPFFKGRVISKREDGPYAQLIIEHNSGKRFWTVYEHIAGITVALHAIVTPETPIARYMNKGELDKYGWQFDHFHFEVMKRQPVKLNPNNAVPDRHFATYALQCFTLKELNEYYYEPLAFLKENN